MNRNTHAASAAKSTSCASSADWHADGHTCVCGQPTAQADAPPVAQVNGVPLHTAGEWPPAEVLKELAWAELLRQRAVVLGLLPAWKGCGTPALTEADRQVLEAMLEQEVQVPVPTDDECQRYFEAHKTRFIVGQSMHVRHILYAVTPGVDVHALMRRAEATLLELSRKDVSPGRFEALAAEQSNCPSGARGGDLGWIEPHDCCPELANELFHQTDWRWGLGVRPRLVQSRHGLHIIEVLARKKGSQPPFEQVHAQIALRLTHEARARALHQYMLLQVGQAHIEGVDLNGSASPLVQ
jgi:peptidyl-prolyl cis-trans isomerase C